MYRSQKVSKSMESRRTSWIRNTGLRPHQLLSWDLFLNYDILLSQNRIIRLILALMTLFIQIQPLVVNAQCVQELSGTRELSVESNPGNDCPCSANGCFDKFNMQQKVFQRLKDKCYYRLGQQKRLIKQLERNNAKNTPAVSKSTLFGCY